MAKNQEHPSKMCGHIQAILALNRNQLIQYLSYVIFLMSMTVFIFKYTETARWIIPKAEVFFF
jgi:hypothetical protein